MPKTFPAPDSHAGDRELYLVSKNGVEHQAHVLERHGGEVYVHYVNTDKRLDEWVAERDVRPAGAHEADGAASSGASRKRKRGSASASGNGEGSMSRRGSPSSRTGRDSRLGSGSGSAQPEMQNADAGRASASVITEEEYDIEHHKQITAKRNFDKVIFGRWEIKTWYFSPYPLTESETDDTGTPSSHTPHSAGRIPGVARSSIRSHGRTSDLLAGGLGRSHGIGQNSALWVCDRCFKYMADGLSWESHIKKCTRKSPPGRKVYQRGAHIIWEVDGAKEKLYCQNLSLFGKLFIDIKTLFFDCDNFFFYILTDADSQRDHVLGFFSKVIIDTAAVLPSSAADDPLLLCPQEKVSYDDYNLACIVVLPPYQKKGYGMLLIEFSASSAVCLLAPSPHRRRRRVCVFVLPLELTFSALASRALRCSPVPARAPGYELSRRAGKIGTPERPLSDLGLRSYLTYWISTLIRFFRRLLSVLPPDTAQITTTGLTADVADAIAAPSPARDTEDGSSSMSKKKRKSTKGWDGEELSAAAVALRTAQANDTNDPMWTALRTVETRANADGSATTHVVVRCTLADLARACNLRVEDAAFALNECGLLACRLPPTPNLNLDPKTNSNPNPKHTHNDSDHAPAEGGGGGGGGDVGPALAITREMVEAAARERDVKRMCMDLAHVLL
ncbi:acyl-CoA N-acyltransferase [Ganoderma leucocontextum]|nr:acyl-CoA N-acyltransferase [Ganoderma leucocontextum]